MLFLVGLSTQQCTIGCSKCTSENVCQLCDTTQMYYLSESTCSKSTLTNCMILSQSGTCVRCNSGFYLDVNTNTCLAIPTANTVANCMDYLSNQACSVCSPSFFLNNGACTAVNTTIANCNLYSADGTCSACKSGYILGHTLADCMQIPSDLNCLEYNYLNCRACKTGFVINRNLYLLNHFSVANVGSTHLSVLTTNTQGVWMSANVCQAVTVQNCQAYSAFNMCTNCAAGYFLKAGNCVEYPKPVIFACMTYSTLTTCTACTINYHLNTSGTCDHNTIIPYCMTYSGSTSTTTCTQCTSDYYLSNATTCTKRSASLSISQCATTNVSSDKCATCNNDHVLTTDGLACMTAIDNCKTYAPSVATQARLFCTICNPGFYVSVLDTVSTCNSGTIENCQVYTAIANTCMMCNNGYYLSNNTCLKHVDITNCTTYSQSTANTCSTCSAGYYSFTFSRVCVATNVISNCMTYSDDGLSCIACNANYYVNSGTCASIVAPFTNCATFNGSVCQVCNSGFMVNTLPQIGTCVEPLDYVYRATNNPCGALSTPASTVVLTWSSVDNTAQAPIKCESCNDFSYGVVPGLSEAICVRDTQLILNEGWVAITNCIRYGLSLNNAKVLVCQECASGYFITGWQYQSFASLPYNASSNPNGIQCTNTCDTALTANAAMVVPDDMVGTVNICLPYADVGRLGATAANYQNCNRVAINNWTTVNTSFGFTGESAGCFIASSGTTAAPFYLTITNLLLTFPAVSYTSPGTNPTFNSPFETVKDAASIYPTVFNYYGLSNPTAAVIASADATASGTNWAATNCNLIYSFPTTKVSAIGSLIRGDAGTGGLTGKTTGLADQAAGTPTYVSCIRCVAGFTPGFVANASIGNRSRTATCISLSNCDNNTVVYGGLPTYLNDFFSCHTCNTNFFPSVYMEVATDGDEVGRFINWAVIGTYPADTVNTVSDLTGFKCHAAPTNIYNADSTTSVTASTVGNCAAYGYFQLRQTAATTSADATYRHTAPFYNEAGNNFAATCIACVANFYPTFIATSGVAGTSFLPHWVVTTCTAGLNCDTTVTTSFNSCTRCTASSGTTYYAFSDYTVHTCYQTVTDNCLILASGSTSASTTNTCEVCKAGYFKNSNNYCEKVTFPNGASSASFYQNYFMNYAFPNGRTASSLDTPTTTNAKRWLKIQSLYNFGLSTGYGISGCASGYTRAASNKWASNVCVTSPYITSNSASIAAGTQFVNNCLRYKVNLSSTTPNNLCARCNTGFIPNNAGTACVTTITNCLVANDATTTLCHTCAADYLNAAGTCTQGAVSNCMTYVNGVGETNNTANPPICSVCNAGYYLSSDSSTCTLGSVANCSTYTQNSATACTACNANYVLINGPSSTKYCYPIASSLNCSTLLDTSASTSFSRAQLTCEKCTSSTTQVYGIQDFFMTNRDAQARTTCLAFTSISRCEVYNQNDADLEKNDFHCSRCAEGYYYASSNRACVERTVRPSRCTTYNLLADVCTACSSGSFLSTDGRSCVLFPDGIYQCNMYSSATNCTQCNAHYYLTNNTCIISTTTVQNCAIYSTDNTCSQCNTGFFLSSPTTCVVPNANNCLTVAGNDACATCATGRGLETTNGITHCVVINVANCATSTTVAPFTCTVCNAGFYADANGACVAVSTTIPNCIEYDSATTCIKCDSTGVLNVARTSCAPAAYTAHIDANCNENYLSNTPSCSQCPLGSYFVDGACTACSNNTIASGCWSCDPTNMGVCLVCATDYHMNSSGACVRNEQTTPTGPTVPTTPAPQSASLLKATMLVFAMFFVGWF